jgi:hypothetical protein
MFTFRKCKVKFLSIAFGAFVALALTGNAWAEGCQQTGSPLASTVGNLKGVIGCANLNNRVSCGLNSGTGSCSAPGFSATAQLQANGTVNWSASGTKKITEVFVYGTNGGNTCQYVYSGGATNGQGLGFLKSNNSYQGVQGVDFCTDNTVAAVTPTCESIGITCPTTNRSLVYKFDLDSAGGSFFNTQPCVCNNGGQPLTQCNPNVPAGQPGACPNLTSKIPTEVTTHIELNNDPYYCQTIGGSRTCFFY